MPSVELQYFPTLQDFDANVILLNKATNSTGKKICKT